jgi:hypothetical protein
MPAVSSRFDEIIHKLNHVADDIKIACAEASLDGDFAQVSKLSFVSVKGSVRQGGVISGAEFRFG